ncbi:MAG: CoA transferase [Thermoplasmata archaeon]|nr:MAG: CoA transferase [Thermoplasmata archaeon]
MEPPLKGIKVLDFTRVIAGSFCTMYLADLGAEVIKIEMPEYGEVMRYQPPVKNGESGFFITLNRGKKSVTLNLKSPETKEIVHKLIKNVDVVVENFKPGVMKELGFDYESLKKVNPAIVYASISGFGQYGPNSDLPSYDLCIQAMCGLMSMNGYPGMTPMRIGNSITDYMSGVLSVVGILCALRVRDSAPEGQGKGQYIDISMFDAGMTMLENSITRYDITGEVAGLIGSHHPSAAPHNIYHTSDGYVAILIIDNNSWKRLTKVMGRPKLGEDPEFATIEARLKNVDRVDEIMEEWTQSKTSQEVMEIFNTHGFACGTVHKVNEVMESEQVSAREMLVTVDQPQLGKLKIPGCPIKFSETPVQIGEPAPLNGQHTQEVLCEMLGYSAEEYEGFKKNKVV